MESYAASSTGTLRINYRDTALCEGSAGQVHGGGTAPPTHVFNWNAAANDAGLLRDAAYLVRPDGYVGLAMPAQTPEGAGQLRRYAASVFSS